MPRTAGNAREVVFVDGVRTPFGKAGPNGLYAGTRADDLVVSLIRELLRRNPGIPPERIGEVAIRLMLQLARELAEHPGARYGLTTMCVGMGMGGTVLWEKI